MTPFIGKIFEAMFYWYIIYAVAWNPTPVSDTLCAVTAQSAIYYEISHCENTKPDVSMFVDWERQLLNYLSPNTFAICHAFGQAAQTFTLFELTDRSDSFTPTNHTQKLFLWVYCIDVYHPRLFHNSSAGLVQALGSCYLQAEDLQPYLHPCFSTHEFKEWVECLKPSNQTTSK